ncbi:2,6-dihydropseudooxynicotine hydrolase [Metarhizium album ARSEF 1941]|uniref:2,6-dihydropseudooxynicotine hydrolase n=1 Tax=Metarhizium album (strain ARSEF 1941) TaxID=1081103 RepID=A0A0B2WRH0_METAS|nr:2,6-dihydropseudooxynicotine hydrolase [Metarhizium album ARSEF 1941]KHN98656.1 2,6-dihydropseudooxynicotine hydrolase [Metarhizium album ARSEF 1941]
MHQFSKDPKFHFEILRALAMAPYDGADIDECLVAANSIVPGDFESFAAAFVGIANTVYERALRVVKTRFPISARTAFFSAATYFRSADFYLHGNQEDPRIMDYWAKQTDAFDQGLALLSPPGTRFNIKTPEFDVPCIWMTPDHEVKQRPTIIMGNGYDGSQEEMYHVAGLAALERGYNVLTYEGPGQPSPRRYQNKGFIAEWEKVVTPIMDHVLNMTEWVDPNAVALYGLSLGGYMAPRVAAFDHRFAAIMAMDGVWDFGAVVRHDFGPDAMKIHASGDKAKFDQLARQYLRPGVPTGRRWGLEQGLWAFNTTSPFDFVTEAQKFTLAKVAHLIRTPVFVGDAEDDIFFKGQPRQLAQAIGKWATLYQFKTKDIIGTHSGIGALKQHNQVIYDWFEDILDGDN